jgi:hypothetical protein
MQGKIVSINIFLIALKKYQLVMQGCFTLSIVASKTKSQAYQLKRFTLFLFMEFY